jgi:phenylalanyl-tRNA synthetase beta chain
MVASILTQFGGKVTKGMIDVFPKARKNKQVVLRHHRMKELIGMDIDSDFIENTLRGLGFQVEEKQPKIWQVIVPHHRIDIEREADLVEEIARFNGYDKIPSLIPPLVEFESASDLNAVRIQEIRQLLFHQGFDEVVNFSFSDPEKEPVFGSSLTPIPIRNPISSKAAQLKTTLIGGLLENVAWNRNRGADSVHIFEIGKLFHIENDRHLEQQILAFATTGFLGHVHWNFQPKGTDFFHLKGTCESIFSLLGFFSNSFEAEDHPFFQRHHALVVYYKGEKIGALGLLRQDLLETFDIKDPVWAAELNLGLLFEKQHQPFTLSLISKYPSVVRDISFIGADNIPYKNITAVLKKMELPHLESFVLINRFAGKPIPSGNVSLTFRFVFRHPTRTLKADEVDNSLKMIEEILKVNFKFQLREGGEN